MAGLEVHAEYTINEGDGIVFGDTLILPLAEVNAMSANERKQLERGTHPRMKAKHAAWRAEREAARQEAEREALAQAMNPGG